MSRSLVSTLLPLLLLASLAAPQVPAAEIAQGVVFVDADRDGVRDEGEGGLSGVPVSNGRDVVLTDEEGRYAIQIEEGEFVFVTKPRGYQVPLSPEGLPLFYRGHYPSGTSPELSLRYPGVEPTGPLPESIDFALVPQDEPESFDVILFADTQPQSDAELSWVRDTAIAPLVGTDAAFGMTLGDIMYDDMALFPRYIDLVGTIGVPWYNVPGNHELNFLADDDEHALETFKRYFGPAYYSFDYANAHFVVLDDVDYLGENAGREPPHPRGIGKYEGRLGETQLAWLEQDLSHVPADRLVVLTMHIPLANYIAPDAASIRVADRRELFGLLAGREHLIAFAGHTHTAEHHYFGADEGFAGPGELHLHTLATVSGSWWGGPLDASGIATAWQRDGAPRGYYVMSVRGNEVKVRFDPVGAPAGPPMRVVFDTAFHGYGADLRREHRHGELLDARVPIDALPSTEILVNLFDGGPRSRVWVTIGERAPIEMARVKRVDPFFEELLARDPDSQKPWVRKLKSSHLWSVGLPDDLGAGLHPVRVRAVDEYGVEHVKTLVLEIDPR